MRKFGYIASAVLCAAVLAASGCNNESNGSEEGSSAAVTSGTVQNNGDIQLKTYAFPEFLSSQGDADMLSNAVYRSFDPAAIMVEPERQPFDGYKCTACFNELYYIFKDGEHYGLMNGSGTELIGSDGIKKISAASVNLLQIKYDDGTTAYFQTDDAGGGVFVVIEDFDESRIGFALNRSASEDGQDTYTLQIDGANVYDTAWLSAETANISELDTSRKCEAVYKVTSGSGSYYITFDKFYNFTVYEAAYGFISLKIGGEYGECYILSAKDYSELETLISSFGRESGAGAPSKDENADYIQITMGLESENRRVLTVSADGYCLTDNISDDSSANDKYFTVMSKETFVDLVNWVDSALGTEYGK